jgi:hypothetical protein
MPPIKLSEWISDFCALHARAKQGQLAPDEMSFYLSARVEIEGVLLVGQRLNLKPGDNPRRQIRIARAFPLELELPSGLVTALTQDISVGGLSALVSSPPPVGTRILYRLKLGRNVDPVTGAAKVVALVEGRGAMRMSLMFEELGPSERGRIELVVFDDIVAQFRAMGA